MSRVSVIGAPGTGKTTFAGRVAEITGARHVELDALWWGPGWRPIPLPEFQRLLQDVVAVESWVIDGYYLDEAARPLIWPRADVIVWLDLPRRTAVARVIRRSARRVIKRTHLWGTNRETAGVLSPLSIYRFVRGWPARAEAIEEAVRAEALSGKEIVRLRDDSAKDAWLDSLAATVSRRG